MYRTVIDRLDDGLQFDMGLVEEGPLNEVQREGTMLSHDLAVYQTVDPSNGWIATVKLFM